MKRMKKKAQRKAANLHDNIGRSVWIAHLRAGVCRLSSPGCLSFLHQVERECFTTKHQQIPGSINMIPKPMKPTPMIVADDLIPKPKVMARGTTPTKAKLTPAPMMAAGPR